MKIKALVQPLKTGDSTVTALQSPKRCSACRTDLTNQKRAKDATGSYFCEPCWRKKAAGPAAPKVEVVTTFGVKKLEYPCDHCGVSIVSEWRLAGRIEKCPACDRACRVPVPNIMYKCPSCSVPLENAGSMGGREDNCPHCGTEHTVPSSLQQKAEKEAEDQRQTRAAYELHKEEQAKKKEEQSNKVVPVEGEIDGVRKPEEVSVFSLKFKIYQLNICMVVLYGIFGLTFLGTAAYVALTALSTDNVLYLIGMLLGGLFLLRAMLVDISTYCPNCKHLKRRKLINAELLDSSIQMETQTRTDVHYDNSYRRTGYTDRQEQVFVRVNMVERWLECKDCGYQWSIVSRERG